MSDFAILLLAAAASAYGTWAALKCEQRLWATLPAVAIYAAVGISMTLFATITGDGRLLPGLQINPDVQAEWRDIMRAGTLPTPEAAYGLFALLAHVLVLMPRVNRNALLRPLPATLAFCLLFGVLQDRLDGRMIRYVYAMGPERGACLTVVPGDDSVRFVISHGESEDAFLSVLYTHEAETTPKQYQIFWTGDGQGIVMMANYKLLLAVDLEGNTTGALPEKSHEWPQKSPVVEPRAARRKFSAARRDVAEFVQSHGRLYVR